MSGWLVFNSTFGEALGSNERTKLAIDLIGATPYHLIFKQTCSPQGSIRAKGGALELWYARRDESHQSPLL